MDLKPIDTGVLEQAQQELKTVTVEEALFTYIVQIARRTREWPSLSLGASPRAAVSLMAVAKAVAAIDGRDYVIPDDVKAASRPVLRHRIVLKPEADLVDAYDDPLGVTAAFDMNLLVRSEPAPMATIARSWRRVRVRGGASCTRRPRRSSWPGRERVRL